MKAITLVMSLLLTIACVVGNVAVPYPGDVLEIQPDGSEVRLRITGHPYHGAFLTDLQGHPVIRNESGWFVFGSIKNTSLTVDGRRQLELSDGVVGVDSPQFDKPPDLSTIAHHRKVIGNIPSNDQQSDLPMGELTIGNENGTELLHVFADALCEGMDRSIWCPNNPIIAATLGRSDTIRPAALGGTLNLIVLLVKFGDQIDRPVADRTKFETLFNGDGFDDEIIPTGSVKRFFQVQSLGKFHVNAYIEDWIVADNTEEYYSFDRHGLTSKFAGIAKSALHRMDSRGTDWSIFDRNNDGIIDGVFIIHSGYAGEIGVTDPFTGKGWGTHRIWSHRTYVGSQDAWFSKDGSIRMGSYATTSAFIGAFSDQPNAMTRIGVVGHEMGHMLGLPDLLSSEGSGVGNYDCMGNMWGKDRSQYFPGLMSAWSKAKVGWIVPTLIDKPGIYSIHAAVNQPEAYKITHGFPDGEYLLLENRIPKEYDANIVGQGILIWHIDENKESKWQQNPGWPIQDGWPGNNNHYQLAVVQADGLYELELGINSGNSNDFWTKGMTLQPGPAVKDAYEIDKYPNTDTYSFGITRNTGITLSSFSNPGDEMSFSVEIAGFEQPDQGVPTKPTTSPSFRSSMMPTSVPVMLPTSQSEIFSSHITLIPTSPSAPSTSNLQHISNYTNLQLSIQNPELSKSSLPPTVNPTVPPSLPPTLNPTVPPSLRPTLKPTAPPSLRPTLKPTLPPSSQPTLNPTIPPSVRPTLKPTVPPSLRPTFNPTAPPSLRPTLKPTVPPSLQPTLNPTVPPSLRPTFNPTEPPSLQPTFNPTVPPSLRPTLTPSVRPSLRPTLNPAVPPSVRPTLTPIVSPSIKPSLNPTVLQFTLNPKLPPSLPPTHNPTVPSSLRPTINLTVQPSSRVNIIPTLYPTIKPSSRPVDMPTPALKDMSFLRPTLLPTPRISHMPPLRPTTKPTSLPLDISSSRPTEIFTHSPVFMLSLQQTAIPTLRFMDVPSFQPTALPTPRPTSTRSPIAIPQIIPDPVWISSQTTLQANEPTQLSLSLSPNFAGSVDDAASNPPAISSTSFSMNPSRNMLTNESQMNVGQDGFFTPTSNPTEGPTASPTVAPSERYTKIPNTPSSKFPTDTSFDFTSRNDLPIFNPTSDPTYTPTSFPSEFPTALQSSQSSISSSSNYTLTANPSLLPTFSPSISPSLSSDPSLSPSERPSESPSKSEFPSDTPTRNPSSVPSISMHPSSNPSLNPSDLPSKSLHPSLSLTVRPTLFPTLSPSIPPTLTSDPTLVPSLIPSERPSESPSKSEFPSDTPTRNPSSVPSISMHPSSNPSLNPSDLPSKSLHPSLSLTVGPSLFPTLSPSIPPSLSNDPTIAPSLSPLELPSESPIKTAFPSENSTNSPSSIVSPTISPPSVASQFPPHEPIGFSWFSSLNSSLPAPLIEPKSHIPQNLSVLNASYIPPNMASQQSMQGKHILDPSSDILVKEPSGTKLLNEGPPALTAPSPIFLTQSKPSSPVSPPLGIQQETFSPIFLTQSKSSSPPLGIPQETFSPSRRPSMWLPTTEFQFEKFLHPLENNP